MPLSLEVYAQWQRITEQAQFGPHDVLHALLYAGHASDDDERWTIVIYVHADVSGHPHDPIMAAGCYLAKEEDLQRATKAWQSTLDDAFARVPPRDKPGKPPVPRVFHATDFFSGWGAFRGWVPGSPIHTEYAQRFAAIASDAELVGFSFAIDNLAFGESLMPVLAEEQREYSAEDLRVFCYMSALGLVHHFLEKAHHSNPAPYMKGAIQPVFEDEQGSERYLKYFNEARWERNEKWTWWFRPISFGGKDVLPLQMADLLAHQSWTRAQDIASDPNAPTNPVFARMLRDGRLEMRLLDEANAEASARVFREVLRSNPRGLVRNVDLPAIRARANEPRGPAASFRRLWARLQQCFTRGRT